MSHQEVANAVGRARASISNALRLLDLPSSVQELVNKKELSMGMQGTAFYSRQKHAIRGCKPYSRKGPLGERGRELGQKNC